MYMCFNIKFAKKLVKKPPAKALPSHNFIVALYVEQLFWKVRGYCEIELLHMTLIYFPLARLKKKSKTN